MTEGYEVALHRSLAEPVMIAGAPRSAAIAIGTLAAVLALGLRLWIPGLAAWVFLHSAAVFLARIDPEFLPVALRACRHREFLAC